MSIKCCTADEGPSPFSSHSFSQILKTEVAVICVRTKTIRTPLHYNRRRARIPRRLRIQKPKTEVGDKSYAELHRPRITIPTTSEVVNLLRGNYKVHQLWWKQMFLLQLREIGKTLFLDAQNVPNRDLVYKFQTFRSLTCELQHTFGGLIPVYEGAHFLIPPPVI